MRLNIFRLRKEYLEKGTWSLQHDALILDRVIDILSAWSNKRVDEMKIYKSEIRRVLESWRRENERCCKTNMCKYESPNLTAEFIRKIAKKLGLPTSEKYLKAIRPCIREMKEEGVIWWELGV